MRDPITVLPQATAPIIEENLLAPIQLPLEMDEITSSIPGVSKPLKERTLTVFSMRKFIAAVCEFSLLLDESSNMNFDTQKSHVGNFFDLSGAVRNNKKAQAIVTFVTSVLAGAARGVLSGYANAPDSMTKFVIAQVGIVGTDAIAKATPSIFDAKNVMQEARRTITQHDITQLGQGLQNTEKQESELLSAARGVISAHNAALSSR